MPGQTPGRFLDGLRVFPDTEARADNFWLKRFSITNSEHHGGGFNRSDLWLSGELIIKPNAHYLLAAIDPACKEGWKRAQSD